MIVAAVIVATVVTTVGRLPTNSRGYYNRGVSDSRDGRFESAIRNFDRSLELDPPRTDALVARSVAWARAGHPYRALADADAALADRLRLREAVAAAETPEVAHGTNVSAAVVSWVHAVDRLARGDRPAAIAALRSAWAGSPAPSRVHDRAWSLLERITLGSRVQDDNHDISMSLSFGPEITVACVRDLGPAGEFGLATGDRLLTLDGVEATTSRVEEIVARGSIGTVVRFEASRRGEPVRADELVGGREGVRLATSAPTR